MNIVQYVKTTLGETKHRLSQNQQIIQLYNFHILKILVALAVILSFVLAVLSLLPAVENLYLLKYQLLFSLALGIFFVFGLLCLFAGDFISRHVIASLYLYVALVDGFSVVLNVFNALALPYTITIGLLLLFSILLMDSRVRVIIFHIVLLIVALMVSYYYKSDEIFFIDLINGTVFCAIGLFVGDFFRTHSIRYLDLREHELDRNVEVLRAKNEAKSSFLANMSHEIRTPINAVLGLNEMILRESTEPNVLGYANDIRNAGRTLISLINDILDFSKIEANKMVIIPAEYQLDSMINDLVNMITPRAQERGLKLRLTIAEDTPNVLYGDDIRIKQCILNLLTNAVKYTNEGYIDLIISGEVLNDRDVNLKVQVKDTGAGIKTENLAKLFSAFERIEEKRFRQTEGTGLGITIVQRLLGKMDSSLQVESEYGVGSTFWFEIRQGIIRRDPIGNFSERLKLVEPPPQENYRETFHAPNARILVIDDMKINLDVVRGLLKRTRVQIDTALSGTESLAMVQKHKYDLIFIDHRMPEMDGIQTLHAMKTLPHNLSADTPCIALTANAIFGAREMYLKEGFVDYISKPVDYIKLEELLMAHLPKMLIQKASFEQNTAGSTAQERPSFLTEYHKIDGINASAALDFCGDLEVLRGAVYDYYESITMQSDLIEKYAAQGDIKNYMILVHGLKSSSRLVGAEKLSKDAAYLEQCAKDEKWDEINRLTPDLLLQFRALKKPFAQVLGEKYTESAAPVAPEPTSEPAAEKPKQAMDGEQMRGALDALSEFIQADDFGAAENIISMVEEYKIPLESAASFDKIKNAIFAKDKDAALSLLGHTH